MDQEFRIAIVVNPELQPGLLANTVGAIGIGLGSAIRTLAGDVLADRHGRRIEVSSNRPVPILQADGDTIRAILLRAAQQPGDRAVVPFPAFARALHEYEHYKAQLPGRDLSEEEIDGVGIAGPARWVRSLTGSLKLLR